MSIIESEINKFIDSPIPEVLAIHGAWGNGKTFFWKKIIQSRSSEGSSLKYAYVSLFGINSLNDLKNSLYENTIYINDTKVKTKNSGISSLWRKLWPKAAKGTPLIKNYVESIDFLTYLSIRDCIICFDDLERKSDHLTINEILGFISVLKEERNCKIVLIYNEDKMDKKSQENFQILKEKVIDKNIFFLLTPEQLDRSGDLEQKLGKIRAIPILLI